MQKSCKAFHIKIAAFVGAAREVWRPVAGGGAGDPRPLKGIPEVVHGGRRLQETFLRQALDKGGGEFTGDISDSLQSGSIKIILAQIQILRIYCWYRKNLGEKKNFECFGQSDVQKNAKICQILLLLLHEHLT